MDTEHFFLYMYTYLDSTAVFGSFYGTSSVFTYIRNLGCSGHENRLIDCSYHPIAHTNCGQGQHAGVRCVGMFNKLLLYSYMSV